MKPLGEIVKIIKGGKAPEVFDEPRPGAYPYLQIEDLRPDPTPKYAIDKDGTIATKEDVLIAWDGANAGTIGFNLEGYIGSTIAILRPTQDDIHAPYLGYFLRSKFSEIQENTTGATIPHVNRGYLESLRLLLPPLPEQRRIASLLSRADRLRRLRRVGDSLSASLLQSVFLEMFGNPKTNSKHWQVEKFNDVCESRLGKMLDEKQQTGKHLRSYLRNINIQWANIDLSDVAQMDFNEKDREEFRLKNGDVLICEGGEVGRSAIWRDEMPECYFQKALHRARPNPKLAIPEYIIWLMFMMAQTGGLGDFTSQVTIAHLTGEKLKELVIPVPSMPQQEQFARVVRQVESLRSRQAESARQGEVLFQALLSQSFGEA